MRLYGIKTCDTCRKALKTLKAAGHAPTFVDVYATPLEASERARFLETLGPEALINRRSTTWKGLSKAERAGAAEDLLLAHPKVMKRPVIETADGVLHLGWTAAVQASVL